MNLPFGPSRGAGSVPALMAHMSRDAFVLECELLTETNANGWAAHTAEKPAPPAPIRAAPPVRPSPAAGTVPAAVFAPAVGPVRICERRDRIYTHEAAHAVVARALGLPVARVLVCQAGFLLPGLSGLVELGSSATGPEFSGPFAVVCASGPVCDELLGYGTGTGEDDRRQVAACVRAHERHTGRPVPFDPFAAARRRLSEPAVAAAVNRVSESLRFNVPMLQEQLDRLIAGRS